MSWRQRLWLGLVVAATLIGCGVSHPADIAGLDPERELVTLSEDEWRALCAWRLALRDRDAGELLRYNCTGGMLYPVTECPGGSCYGVDWTEASCLERERSYVLSLPTTCRPTVADSAACYRAIDAQPCVLPLPECAALSCADE